MAMDIRFDGARVAYDMAAQGFDVADLARRARVSSRTVYRFVNNETQSLRAAKAIAKALGYSVRRYLVSVGEMEPAGARRVGR